MVITKIAFVTRWFSAQQHSFLLGVNVAILSDDLCAHCLSGVFSDASLAPPEGAD
jgi:hypothetical protein